MRWTLKDNSSGAFYLVSDNCTYFIQVWSTPYGERAQVLDYSFFKVSNEMKVSSAKRYVKQLLTGGE